MCIQEMKRKLIAENAAAETQKLLESQPPTLNPSAPAANPIEGPKECNAEGPIPTPVRADASKMIVPVDDSPGALEDLPHDALAQVLYPEFCRRSYM